MEHRVREEFSIDVEGLIAQACLRAPMLEDTDKTLMEKLASALYVVHNVASQAIDNLPLAAEGMEIPPFDMTNGLTEQ